MPGRRFRRRRFPRSTRRTFRKLFRKRRTGTMIRFSKAPMYQTPSQAGWPTQRVVKLRFAGAHTFNLAAPNTNIYLPIIANGTFQPTPPSTHQPMGQDQWAVFYERYAVLRSKIYTEWTSANNGNGHRPLAVAITLNDQNDTPPVDMRNVVENSAVNWTILQQQTNGEKPRLNLTYNAKKWHNVKDVKDADTLEAELDQGDPQDITEFRLHGGMMDGTNTLDARVFTVSFLVEYVLLLKDPNKLPPSVGPA